MYIYVFIIYVYVYGLVFWGINFRSNVNLCKRYCEVKVGEMGVVVFFVGKEVGENIEDFVIILIFSG